MQAEPSPYGTILVLLTWLEVGPYLIFSVVGWGRPYDLTQSMDPKTTFYEFLQWITHSRSAPGPHTAFMSPGEIRPPCLSAERCPASPTPSGETWIPVIDYQYPPCRPSLRRWTNFGLFFFLFCQFVSSDLYFSLCLHFLCWVNAFLSRALMKSLELLSLAFPFSRSGLHRSLLYRPIRWKCTDCLLTNNEHWHDATIH